MSSQSPVHFHKQIQEFIDELNGFTGTAEETLKAIESNPADNKNSFHILYEKMLAIRGTAQQLQLNHIARIAGLGEEISLKGESETSRPKIRRCVGCLWDALTTVKYLLEHYKEETTEEQEILIHRLEDTLRILGGPQPKFSPDEIEKMLRGG